MAYEMPTLTAEEQRDLRDRFAMAALQGMLAATENGSDWPPYGIAVAKAYEYADAMLAARDA